MASNRDGIEQIADALIERKELHGDEVGELLDSVRLQASRPRPDRPEDMADDMSDQPPVARSTDEHAVGACRWPKSLGQVAPGNARARLPPRASVPHRDGAAGRRSGSARC